MLYRIDPSPNFLQEDMTKRHLHIRLNTTNDFYLGTIWNSDENYPPQQTTTPINALGTTELYAFVQMNFVSDSGGVLSPFEVGTTPYFKGLGLSYTLTRL
jgi:hypothetical protein